MAERSRRPTRASAKALLPISPASQARASSTSSTASATEPPGGGDELPRALHAALRSPAQSQRAAPADSPGLLGHLLWNALCDDAGCSVTLFLPDAQIVWANARTVIDYEWHMAQRQSPEAPGSALDPLGKPLDHVLSPAFARERAAFIARAAASGEVLVYESILRGVRQRVCLRRLRVPDAAPAPIDPTAPGLQTYVLVVARRLRAIERIEDALPPNAVLLTPREQDRGPLAALSQRELEVLKLVGEGLTSPSIARRLHRSVRTVEGHRNSICKKLGLSSNADLVRVAIHAGLGELADAPDAAARGVDSPPGTPGSGSAGNETAGKSPPPAKRKGRTSA
ncbi:MAG: helix-turn-helix transcriptional regulator [Planctomycetota bacterium]|nr:helix-turn-helix transcriptional regulator [Planctomycetota bacterium]